MKGTNLEVSKKHNSGLVDLIFGLMFDILWIAPYDHRRQDEAFLRFERSARNMAERLCSTDVARIDVSELDEIRRTAAEIADSIEQLNSKGIISRDTYRRAAVQAGALIAALEKESEAVVGAGPCYPTGRE